MVCAGESDDAAGSPPARLPPRSTLRPIRRRERNSGGYFAGILSRLSCCWRSCSLTCSPGAGRSRRSTSERRIVHLTLATHEFVTTHSEGEGDNRRVIVEPRTRRVVKIID